MNDSPIAPAVVVGLDGSMTALRAALWAVDEAVNRDIPLRLVYALGREGSEHLQPDCTVGRLATAESAVRHVIAAVEATGKPVKIEVDITRGAPISTLVCASRSAVMVCVGAVGSHHFQPDRFGSTAATVAALAHCPVAVIHGPGRPTRPHRKWVLVEADTSPDNAVVLESAVAQARLRAAPLRVISCWRPPYRDRRAVAEGDGRIRAQLERALAPWRRRYPDIQIEALAVHGSILDYLAKTSADVHVLVVGARDAHHLRKVVGPAGCGALADCDCAVLVVDHRHL